MKSSIDSKDDGHFISNSHIPSFEKLSLIEKLEIHGSNPDLSSLASSSNTSKPPGDTDEKWHCQVKSHEHLTSNGNLPTFLPSGLHLRKFP